MIASVRARIVFYRSFDSSAKRSSELITIGHSFFDFLKFARYRSNLSSATGMWTLYQSRRDRVMSQPDRIVLR